MDESNYYFKRSHAPAFGSWDCSSNNEIPIPYTECFESAREAGLFHYSYSHDSDLYVTVDLYQNDIVTPTMIVVKKKASYKEARKEAWVMCDFEKEPPSPLPISPPTTKSVPKKPIDEDLYKISPALLFAKPTRKGVRAIISSCLRPACAC